MKFFRLRKYPAIFPTRASSQEEALKPHLFVLLTPGPHIALRPEEQHRRSSKADIAPPVACGHGEVHDAGSFYQNTADHCDAQRLPRVGAGRQHVAVDYLRGEKALPRPSVRRLSTASAAPRRGPAVRITPERCRKRSAAAGRPASAGTRRSANRNPNGRSPTQT